MPRVLAARRPRDDNMSCSYGMSVFCIVVLVLGWTVASFVCMGLLLAQGVHAPSDADSSSSSRDDDVPTPEWNATLADFDYEHHDELFQTLAVLGVLAAFAYGWLLIPMVGELGTVAILNAPKSTMSCWANLGCWRVREVIGRRVEVFDGPLQSMAALYGRGSSVYIGGTNDSLNPSSQWAARPADLAEPVFSLPTTDDSQRIRIETEILQGTRYDCTLTLNAAARSVVVFPIPNSELDVDGGLCGGGPHPWAIRTLHHLRDPTGDHESDDDLASITDEGDGGMEDGEEGEEGDHGRHNATRSATPTDADDTAFLRKTREALAASKGSTAPAPSPSAPSKTTASERRAARRTARATPAPPAASSSSSSSSAPSSSIAAMLARSGLSFPDETNAAPSLIPAVWRKVVAGASFLHHTSFGAGVAAVEMPCELWRVQAGKTLPQRRWPMVGDPSEVTSGSGSGRGSGGASASASGAAALTAAEEDDARREAAFARTLSLMDTTPGIVRRVHLPRRPVTEFVIPISEPTEPSQAPWFRRDTQGSDAQAMQGSASDIARRVAQDRAQLGLNTSLSRAAASAASVATSSSSSSFSSSSFARGSMYGATGWGSSANVDPTMSSLSFLPPTDASVIAPLIQQFENRTETQIESDDLLPVRVVLCGRRVRATIPGLRAAAPIGYGDEMPRVGAFTLNALLFCAQNPIIALLVAAVKSLHGLPDQKHYEDLGGRGLPSEDTIHTQRLIALVSVGVAFVLGLVTYSLLPALGCRRSRGCHLCRPHGWSPYEPPRPNRLECCIDCGCLCLRDGYLSCWPEERLAADVLVQHDAVQTLAVAMWRNEVQVSERIILDARNMVGGYRGGGGGGGGSAARPVLRYGDEVEP